MTKNELKKKIEGSIALTNKLNVAMQGGIQHFRIVTAKLKDGGQVDYYYDLETGKLIFQFKNTDSAMGTKKSLNDVPEFLSELLSQTDCIVRKYVWLGE